MRRALLTLLPALVLAASIVAPAQATFPGSPGPIVYARSTASESGSTGGLFSHGPRQSQKPHQLTSASGDGAPAVSADGRMIAFSGDRDPVPSSGSHIYVMEADGSDVRELTSGAAYDSDPSFSPDGSHVVFGRIVGSGRSRIFSVDVDGSELEALTDGSSSASEPAFTPNGRRIVYVGNGDSDGRTDRSDIFAMAPDGSGQRVLIDGIRNETEPDVSPTGRDIAFVSNRDHGPNVFIAKSNGTRVREVTHSKQDCFSSACYFAPAWSPDGKHLAYLREGRYSSDLVVSRLDGSHSREFDEGGTEEEGYGSHIGAPAWSPVP